MNRLIVLTLSMSVLLSACGNDEQEESYDDYYDDYSTSETEEYKDTENYSTDEAEKEKTDVINNLPDFTISLQSFVEEYRVICEGEDAFIPIEKEYSEIELVEESGNYIANLFETDTNTSHVSLTAMFDGDKKFKRLSYVYMTKGEESAAIEGINNLLGISYALDIESSVIADLTTDSINYESDGTNISAENYSISSSKIGDALVVAIDGKE